MKSKNPDEHSQNEAKRREFDRITGYIALIDHSVALQTDHPELMFFQVQKKSCLSS